MAISKPICNNTLSNFTCITYSVKGVVRAFKSFGAEPLVAEVISDVPFCDWP